MSRQQVTKQITRKGTELDLRSPSGRALPF